MSLIPFFFNRLAEPTEQPSALVAPYNATAPLALPRIYSRDDATHPSVIDFGTEPGGWFGADPHRFWMAFTPFPPSEHENPCVLCSHDGVEWTQPVGITNPIAPQPGVAAGANSYNSDTDLIHDPIANRLGVVWRAMGVDNPDGTFTAGAQLHIKWSSDGAQWSEMLNVSGGQDVGVSPAVVRDPDGTWAMFTGNNGYMRRAREVTGPWTSYRQLEDRSASDTTGAIWHLDVIHHRGQYRMLASADRKFIPGVSENGTEWRYGNAVLAPIMPWEIGADPNGGMYRATFTPHENGADYRVWYGTSGGWRIGYCEIPQRHWSALG